MGDLPEAAVLEVEGLTASDVHVQYVPEQDQAAYNRSTSAKTETDCAASVCESTLSERKKTLSFSSAEATSSPLLATSTDESRHRALHTARSLLNVLSEAVKIRVDTVPPAAVTQCAKPFDGAAASPSQSVCSQSPARLAVLFSGGVDSMVLAALAGQ